MLAHECAVRGKHRNLCLCTCSARPQPLLQCICCAKALIVICTHSSTVAVVVVF